MTLPGGRLITQFLALSGNLHFHASNKSFAGGAQPAGVLHAEGTLCQAEREGQGGGRGEGAGRLPRALQEGDRAVHSVSRGVRHDPETHL